MFNFLLTGCSIEPEITVPKEYQLGQTSYHRVCAQCHGSDAKGGKRAPTFLQVKFNLNNFSNSRIAKTILNGSNSGAMPSQQGRLNDEEIREIKYCNSPRTKNDFETKQFTNLDVDDDNTINFHGGGMHLCISNNIDYITPIIKQI